MNKNQEITNLEQLLDRINAATKDKEQVSLGAILQTVGHRSFGPFLLLAGVITLVPIVGDIPGVPTIMAVLVLLTAGQLLFRRKHLWLPRWLLRRSVAQDKLRKGLKGLRPIARFIDRFLRPRLMMFTGATGIYITAIACIAIAAVMPLLEVVPFSANIAGAALTAFGLSLIAHDGLLALFAWIFTAGTFGVVIYNFL